MVKLKEKTPGRGFSGWWIMTLIACTLLTPAAGHQTEADTGSILLKIEGAKSSKGVIRISLFNEEGGFPSDSKKALKIISVPAKNGTVQVQLDNLPTGTYAIALLHDENQNGQLDTNLVGYPKEGYGASNNNLPTFRAPNFKEAAFKLESPKKELVIRLSY